MTVRPSDELEAIGAWGPRKGDVEEGKCVQTIGCCG